MFLYISYLAQVDSTPPVVGAFAIQTDHAAAMTRHRSGWMTYDGSALRLAWLGFTDAHCDVMTYYVTVGTKFHSSDLLVRASAGTTNE